MKKLILILAFSVGAFFGWEHQDELIFMFSSFEEPENARNIRNPIRTQNLKLLYRQDKELIDLKTNGSYTVVIVTSPECGECVAQMDKIKEFTKTRRDVVIQKVESEVNPEIFGEPGALADHQTRYMKGIIDAYQLTRTPHIEIYGPNGELIASDINDSKAGTRYLKKWMDYESKPRY